MYDFHWSFPDQKSFEPETVVHRELDQVHLLYGLYFHLFYLFPTDRRYSFLLHFPTTEDFLLLIKLYKFNMVIFFNKLIHIIPWFIPKILFLFIHLLLSFIHKLLIKLFAARNELYKSYIGIKIYFIPRSLGYKPSSSLSSIVHNIFNFV